MYNIIIYLREYAPSSGATPIGVHIELQTVTEAGSTPIGLRLYMNGDIYAGPSCSGCGT